MSMTLRMTRSFAFAATAGLLLLGAVGCGAVNESEKETGSETSSSESSASEASSATPSGTSGGDSTAPSDDRSAASRASDRGRGAAPAPKPAGPKGGFPSVRGEPVELDPTPLTDAEKEEGKQLMADLMVGIVTKGDFSKACDVVVYKTPDGQRVRVDNSPELREQCAQSTAAMFGQGQGESGENKGISEEQAKTLFSPSMFDVSDNGDGTFALSMQGQPSGLNVVKIKNGGVRLEAAQN